MVNQLANNGLAGDGSNTCLFNSMYLLVMQVPKSRQVL
jgi:hypothetical protein